VRYKPSSGKRSIESGIDQVQLAGKILGGVTDAVQTICDMNQQIAVAAEEQTLVTEDISRNLSELVVISASNQETCDAPRVRVKACTWWSAYSPSWKNEYPCCAA
jgi:formylmethanofuran dehydrogenase subunit B